MTNTKFLVALVLIFVVVLALEGGFALHSAGTFYTWLVPPETAPSSRPVVSNWPMFRLNLEHTATRGQFRAEKVSLLWKYQTGYWVSSSPAVCDGRVFVGSGDYNVYCLDAADGSLMWKYWTENYVMSSPAVCDGRILDRKSVV